jgi:hypothetical protein
MGLPLILRIHDGIATCPTADPRKVAAITWSRHLGADDDEGGQRGVAMRAGQALVEHGPPVTEALPLTIVAAVAMRSTPPVSPP